jgi:hypothetical protein
MHDPLRLQKDVDQSVISMESVPAPGEQLEPSQLTTRVLVRMSSTEPLSAMPDVRWIRIVEGGYACEVPLPRLQQMAEHRKVDFVEAGRLLVLALDTSLPETHADKVQQPAAGVPGSVWIPLACGRSGGTRWAQTRSTGPSPGASCTWRLRVAGCRCRCW